jgi:hypothetical protein
MADAGGAVDADGSDEKQFVNSQHLMHNTKIITTCRTSLCALAGIATGKHSARCNAITTADFMLQMLKRDASGAIALLCRHTRMHRTYGSPYVLANILSR